jgi:GH43 family beta-xylosidase
METTDRDTTGKFNFFPAPPFEHKSWWENTDRHELTSRRNSFFNSPDGTEIWNIYHATAIATGACDGNRYTAAKKVEWNADGSPNFGRPDRVGTVLTGPSGEKA